MGNREARARSGAARGIVGGPAHGGGQGVHDPGPVRGGGPGLAVSKEALPFSVGVQLVADVRRSYILLRSYM